MISAFNICMFTGHITSSLMKCLSAVQSLQSMYWYVRDYAIQFMISEEEHFCITVFISKVK